MKEKSYLLIQRRRKIEIHNKLQLTISNIIVFNNKEILKTKKERFNRLHVAVLSHKKNEMQLLEPTKMFVIL